MKINLPALLLIIGISLGFSFRYLALELNRYTFFSVFFLIFINLLHYKIDHLNYNFSSVKRFIKIYLISFFFQTSILFFVAKFFNLNEKFVLGVIFANICPFAIVLPQFCNQLGWSAKKSSIYVLVSHLLFPFLVPLFFWLFNFKHLFLSFKILFLDAVLLTVLPVILVFIFNKLSPFRLYLKSTSQKVLPILNMLIIGFVAFTCMGGFLTKTNLDQVLLTDLLIILLIAILQDFGSLAIGLFFKLDREEILITSVKNVVVSCSLSLMYFPKAALPALVVLCVHSILFLFYRRIFQ